MWINPGRLDLTYCTNIHPGENWPEVRANIETHVLALKQQLSPKGSFGIGLRLSATAAEQLSEGSELSDFKAFLDANDLYVAVINGFPYGSFNCGVIKAEVFSPDWREASRANYTVKLANILCDLLPPGIDGGISTMPLSYKPWLTDGGATQAWPAMIANLITVAASLVSIHRETGKLIHLDIEPEPNGLIESTAELIRFFEGPLTQLGVPFLSSMLGLSPQESRQLLFEHIRVCFDTCHMSVEYEDPIDSLQQLTARGIRVGRIQISSALHARFDQSAEVQQHVLAQLQPFAESVYLHQVIERQANASLRRYEDLPNALGAPLHPDAREWRIHYHVPIFTSDYGSLSSNHQTNRDVLSSAALGSSTSHLEIETYTWDVLPAPFKIDLIDSIAREYRWVLDQIPRPGSQQNPATLYSGVLS